MTRDGRMGRVTAVLCAAAGVWIGTRFEDVLRPACLPLLLAAIAAKLVSPSADALSRAFRLNRKTAGAIWAFFLCALLLWLAGLLGGRLASELAEILGQLPGWIVSAADRAESLFRYFRSRFPVTLPASVSAEERAGTQGFLASLLIRAASALAEKTAGLFGQTVRSFPGGFLSLAAGAVAFVWLTADAEGAWMSFLRLFPPSAEAVRPRVESFRRVCQKAGDGMSRYLRAYLILTGVIFTELLTGFWLLRVGNAPAAALLTAFVDILPVLGCGTVLAPWAAFCLFSGHIGRGICLIVLLCAVWGTRQFLEPRLVGRAAGIHPFLALSASYLGLRLFGPGGLLICAVLFAMSGGGADREKLERKKGLPCVPSCGKERMDSPLSGQKTTDAGISPDNPDGTEARR